MRSVLSGPPVQARILVPTRGRRAVGGSMSLYRAGLKLALFLPLGVAMPPSTKAPSGFTDVSSVFIRPLRADATIDRTPVRKPYASASTHVAVSLILTQRYPSSREDATPADGDS